MNDGVNVLTAHGENYRLGWNQHETLLTPHNVRVPYFGEVWATRMQGFGPGEVPLHTPDLRTARVYTQPLYVSGVITRSSNGRMIRDLVIIGTAGNLVVALDAVTGEIVWATQLPTPLNDDDFNADLDGGGCKNTSPWHGIDSTPVIDPSGKVVYVAYLTGTRAPSLVQTYYLDALSVADGGRVWPQSVELAGSYGPVQFLSSIHTQRAGLTYVPGFFAQAGHDAVLVPFSSRCDTLSKDQHDWQGWIFAVDVTAVPPPAPLAFASSQAPKGFNGCGGIWGSAGVSVDDAGRLYAVTGNGQWNGTTNFANTMLRLGPTGFGVGGYYTPRASDQIWSGDYDLGGSSATLLPPQPLDPVGKVFGNLLVTGGKDGHIYFVCADGLEPPQSLNRGHAMWRPKVYAENSKPYDGGIAVTPAYFDAGGSTGRFLYFASAADGPYHGLAAVKLDDLNGESMLGARVIQFNSERFRGAPGTPFVSSNGQDNGIVWVVDSFRGEDDDGPASVLRAFDAVTGRLLYSSPKTPAQQLGDGRKFVGLIVVKGRAFVPADGVVCYGLKNEDS
jgi:hypothetical protein